MKKFIVFLMLIIGALLVSIPANAEKSEEKNLYNLIQSTLGKIQVNLRNPCTALSPAI